MIETAKIRVLLSAEGTYPFHQGGVSTWCDTLVRRLTDVEFIVYSVVMNPYVTQKYSLPENASMIKVPLWGTEDPGEHLQVPFSRVYTSKGITDLKVIEEHFIPLFSDLIRAILQPEKNPVRFGGILLELHKYFRYYDYKTSFKSEITWSVFKDIISASVKDNGQKLAQPSTFDLIQSLGWLYRFLVTLNTPVPVVNVTHSVAAGFCGIPCILAKLENKTPFLLTEHGVYLREQYLSMSRRGYSSYLTTFLIRLIHSVVNVNYALADQVSPVCKYNARWETMFGVSPKEIEVIYNGVDRDVFSPAQEVHATAQLTVVSVARVDPVKDLITLIKSSAIVMGRMPQVKFIVYGSVSVPEYYEECLALVKELNLEGRFIFAGHTNDTPAAYRSGDVIALSSITEAFPYLVVEAMMTGKPVVATDVGGVREAVGDCGLVVRPRRPEEFAEALFKLLNDSALRASIGSEARERALNFFTVEKMQQLYLNSYRKLAAKLSKPRTAATGALRQRLLAEKAYILTELGYWPEAITQFRLAIQADLNSASIPVLLLEIAAVFNKLGCYDLAFREMEKAEAITAVLLSSKTA